jgi:2-(1,2-epoxy-1,2-dihydrophenyl)acetyl-CoA isomerase
MIKHLVYQSLRVDLRTHLDQVSSSMAVVRETEDHQEGVRAFKEKRSPKFEGTVWDKWTAITPTNGGDS